jgi:hypothetical protein
LQVNGTEILINGKIAKEYTLPKITTDDGDNRNNSEDSRYRFVPENHIMVNQYLYG